MQTMVPQGREAVSAWRALGSVSQHAAWQAARADCLFLAVIGPLIATYLRIAVRPVVACFGPEGWQLPHTAGGLSGTWDEVLQIRVRAPTGRIVNAGDGPYSWRTAVRRPGSRIVTLVVADPEAYLRRFSALSRPYARSAIRSFGSPIVIPADAKRTIGAAELVGLLRGYTSAPVNWAEH